MVQVRSGTDMDCAERFGEQQLNLCRLPQIVTANHVGDA
jgi:hypothetical protein